MRRVVVALLLLTTPVFAVPNTTQLVRPHRHENNFNKRLRAVMSLLRLHDASALPELKKAIKDRDPVTRALTCVVLSGYDSATATPLLEAAENDSVDVVRRSAK